MALETPNLVHALGTLALNNPDPEIIKGFGLESITRVAAGAYCVRLRDPVVFEDGTAVATPLGSPASMVSASLVAEPGTSDYPAGSVQVLAYDAAGAAADGRGCSLVVYRYPTTD